MGVHVEQVSFEVIPEPEPQLAPQVERERPWDALARFRALEEAARRDGERTRAEGYRD